MKIVRSTYPSGRIKLEAVNDKGSIELTEEYIDEPIVESDMVILKNQEIFNQLSNQGIVEPSVIGIIEGYAEEHIIAAIL